MRLSILTLNRRAFPAFLPTTLEKFLHTHHSLVSSPLSTLSPESHLVVRSSSNDIFENLALEEALLSRLRLQKGNCLLYLYVNAPCVVVGRNQNFLKEVSMRQALQEGIRVARRSSGGGAVYHDEGNLCLSFFTHRSEYAPDKSIQVVRAALCTAFGISPNTLTTTKRHDLFLDGKKISGSAMRVQKEIAYHHCTLLLSSSRNHLGRYLRSEADTLFFKTAALSSVRSPVTTIENELQLKKEFSSLLRDSSSTSSPSSRTSFSSPPSIQENMREASLLVKPLQFMSFMASFFHQNCMKIMKAHEKEVTSEFISDLASTSAPLSSAASELNVCVSPSDGCADLHTEIPFSYHVDVKEAMHSFCFTEEEKKCLPSSSKINALMLADEVERAKSLSWLWNMPKFESVIAISSFQLEEEILGLLSNSSSSMWGKHCLEVVTLAFGLSSSFSHHCHSIQDKAIESQKGEMDLRNDIVEELLNYIFSSEDERSRQVLYVRSVVMHRSVSSIDCFCGQLTSAITKKKEESTEENCKKELVDSDTFASSNLRSLPFFSALLSSIVKEKYADTAVDEFSVLQINEVGSETAPSSWKAVWDEKEESLEGLHDIEKRGRNDFNLTLDLPTSCHLPCAAVLMEGVIRLWMRKNNFNFRSSLSENPKVISLL